MLKEYLKALLLIFAAEMGDKTQIIAMTFATRYSIKEVILGVIIGVFFNHGIAIILGTALSNVIPMNKIQIVASLMFIAFGFLSLTDDDEDEEKKKSKYGPILTVATAFFVGELGDKTQLTALSLSTEASFPFIILLGTISGMVLTSSMGIFVGSKIGDKIPETSIKIASSLIFAVLGTLKLYSVLSLELLPFGLPLVIGVGLVELFLIRRFRRNKQDYPLKDIARELYGKTEGIKESLDSVCLGCDSCDGKCLLGYIRRALTKARTDGDYYKKLDYNFDEFLLKDYNRTEVEKSLKLIADEIEKNDWSMQEDFVVNHIRLIIENYLFGKTIDAENIKDYKEKLNKLI